MILSRTGVIGGVILLASGLTGAAAAASDAAAAVGGAAALDWLALIATMAAPLALILAWWQRWYRLDGVAPMPAAFNPPTGLGLFLLMYVAGIAGAGFAWIIFYPDLSHEQVLDLPLSGMVRLTAGHAAGQALVALVYAWLVIRAGGVAGRRVPAAALAGAGAMVLVWPLVSGVSFLSGLVSSWISEEPAPRIAHDTLQHLVDGPKDAWFVAMGVLVVLVVPVLEEVMYRGLLQRTLGAVLGRWPAIVVTSVVFALMHVEATPWHALPALFVLSIGFGWIYERTRCLAAPVVMHQLFNAANLGLACYSSGS